MFITKTSRLAGLTSATYWLLVLRCTYSAEAQLYWDINGKTGGASSGQTAAGIWGAGLLWSTSADGTVPTRAWTAGQQAIFSAGNNAFGQYTVTISGNQSISGIVFQEGSVTLRDGSLTLRSGTGGDTISVASGLVATIESGISGTDGLIKDGDGTLVLAGANTYSALTDLRRGTLVIASDYGLGTSTLSLRGGAISAGDAPVTLNNAVRIANDTTIQGLMGLTLAGDVLQCGGDRTLTFLNSGGTTFSGATMTLSDSTKQNHTLTLDVQGGDVTISSIIRDGGPKHGDVLVKEGAGRLILTGDNTFSGGLDVNAGTVSLGSDSAAGDGALTLGDGVVIGGLYGTRHISNDLVMSGNVTFAGTDLVFSSPFRLGGFVTFTVENTTTFDGDINGGFVWLTKEGNGTLVFNGDNRFGGLLSMVFVNTGTFGFGSDTAMGKAENILFLNGGAVKAVGGPHTLANPVLITSDSRISGGQNLTLAGTVNNPGGSHIVTIENTGLSAFSGSSFTLGSGTLTLDVLQASGGLTILGKIQDGTSAGALVKNGGGLLTLGGSTSNSFSGGVTINSGTLTTAKANALGSGPLTVTAGTLNLGTFNQLAGSVTLVSGVIDGQATLTAPSFQAQSGTVNASLAGTGALTKSTAGTLTLASANTYSGGTTIQGGTVIVKNPRGSGTGSGPVRVNNGGVLAGNGSVSGPITLSRGGTISPGLGVGSLSTAGESWNSGSIFAVEMSDVDAGEGIGWDLLRITGSLSIHGSAVSPVFVDFQSLDLSGTAGLVHDFSSSSSYAWRIVTTTGGILLDAGETVEGAFDLLLGGFQNDLNGGTFGLSLTADGKDLMLSFMSVPEPSSASMAVLGFVLLFVRFRVSGRMRNASAAIGLNPDTRSDRIERLNHEIILAFNSLRRFSGDHAPGIYVRRRATQFLRRQRAAVQRPRLWRGRRRQDTG